MKKTYSSRTADKFVVRLPDGMRLDIQGIAVDQHRSMNSQIINWLEVCVELETQGIPVSLSSVTELVYEKHRIAQLEAMLEKLLKYGQWFGSAIEIDVHQKDEAGKFLDGEELEREIRALLASKQRGTVLVEQAPVAVQGERTETKRKYIPRSGDPVIVKETGKLGIVDYVYIANSHPDPKEWFEARVKLHNGEPVYVKIEGLMEP
uniref:Arc-like DNA binding domain protein n=1 Tax=Pseudomonas phage HRDY3 TaxID=3236930 RepID=A0AB39CDJ4_9VIRU